MTSGYFLGWGAITLAMSAYLAVALTTESGPGKALFLPGATTAGHYQIELACAGCHTPFEGVSNASCLACHDEDLRAADDSHPRSKFTDPRNAELVSRLDATTCTSCHREHVPDITRRMGVTLPDDYCYTCHADIGRERRSHQGMAFDSCASAGCHNYHDNTALYEDFLVAHAGEPVVRVRPEVPRRSLRTLLNARGVAPLPALASLSSDAPAFLVLDAVQLAAWESAVHARAGVNCTGCHTAAGAAGGAKWMERPGARECAACHDGEVKGFSQGRHGMRGANGLSPMTPALARQPMRPDARDRELSCTSCHGAHDFDTQRAAMDACLACHDDRHSRAYVGSPHHALWVREREGRVAAGSGVSCATCHLPRVAQRIGGADVVQVQHNQNANLRPNEKMLRTVCLGCHGLGFSVDALADAALVAAGFNGRPSRSVGAIEMAAARARAAHDGSSR